MIALNISHINIVNALGRLVGALFSVQGATVWRTPLNVTTRSCHCVRSSVAGEVTATARGARPAPAARARPATPPGGSGGGASYHSSSADDVTSSHGATVRAATTRDLPFLSSPLLRVSSPVCAPWRVGFGTRFLPKTNNILLINKITANCSFSSFLCGRVLAVLYRSCLV